MAIQAQIPGGPMVVMSTAKTAQVPGAQVVVDVTAAATTVTQSNYFLAL